MKTSADNLRQTIQHYRPLLEQIREERAAEKPLPDKWSLKEIMGHLIDSAANNHQRFVRAQDPDEDVCIRYDQNFWIAAQHYQEASWADLISFWHGYNQHLAHVIAKMKPDALTSLVDMGYPEKQTLQYVVEDYVRHLQHHLEQICSGAQPDQRQKWHTVPVK